MLVNSAANLLWGDLLGCLSDSDLFTVTVEVAGSVKTCQVHINAGAEAPTQATKWTQDHNSTSTQVTIQAVTQQVTTQGENTNIPQLKY